MFLSSANPSPHSKEDDLLELVVEVNRLYEEKLKRKTPFLTFVLCGMQSTGKSTIMERFMNEVINVVEQGTGTRCPLNTTCIHDDKASEPTCSLLGDELSNPGLTVKEVFHRINEHNTNLTNAKKFSTKPLRLVYRANNVQNMRFVDTPGLICTKAGEADNREEIKNILRSEVEKPNTKLCVLIEPKDFEMNEIFNFCDGTFGEREVWMGDAIFLMTKFDKQVGDTETGRKANIFFDKLHAEGCFPYLVMTPTLKKVDLSGDKLYEARRDILVTVTADQDEMNFFSNWQKGHDRYREEDPDDEALNLRVASQLGFQSAKTVMRQILIQDTFRRLPEVLAEIQKVLSVLEEEKEQLDAKIALHDQAALMPVILDIGCAIATKMKSYIEGNLQATRNFPDFGRTLAQEINDEKSSDWVGRALNDHSATEDEWRDCVKMMEADYPEHIHPKEKLSGGKQVQRALDFFHFVTINSLPDPYDWKDEVRNSTGFVSGGLIQENWEGSAVQVIEVCTKKLACQGVNYLIKHIGSIYRQLFRLALMELSPKFKLLPGAVKQCFLDKFDESLWKLMTKAAEYAHISLEPMVRTWKQDHDDGHAPLRTPLTWLFLSLTNS
jgi:Dynamin family